MQPVIITKHEPERRRKSVTTLHCGCTCCCCCCLHTIGSIVAAAVAPGIGSGSSMPLIHYYDDETGIQVPSIKKPGMSSVTVFWWLTSFLVFVCFVFGILQENGTEAALVTGIIVALVFPGIQLVSAFITLIVYATWPRYDRAYQLGQLGKICGGVVIGSIVGILAMVAIGFGLSAISK
jgi:hypothetical protein